ncbi:hypothetical protein K1T71_004724 [Dendrolimus kikuchii]|uniref:Uncharacterized protein n=1 Tax=Dendrolimus kikuchii TaxID=765133 RepID=A0ACC1D973_9NEOP|nr:hypothetical protein K1T71_004724 [Dendrolimus kikuchii]
MALILRKACEGYQILFDDLVDPRTKSWPFVAKPYQTLAVLALYLMFVLKWGPKFMHKRKPFNLDNILIAYNTAQVLACLYVFYESINVAWGSSYKWLCEPLDTSYSEHALAITRCVYYYYLTKFVDLFDTSSPLYITHNTSVTCLIWGYTMCYYVVGGHGTLIGVINSFVHTVMYTYYLVTVIYPKAKDSIWWKKHITQLQILQFLWCVIHMAAIVFIPDCAYPRWTSAVFLPQNIFMLVLFIDFYIKTYIKKPPKAASTLKNGITTTQEHSFKNGTRDLKEELCVEEHESFKNLNLERNISVNEEKKENGVSLIGSYFTKQLEREKDN